MAENEIPEFRTGIGFDSHPLVEGRKLILGGVDVLYHLGLSGHSDGDAVSHAVIDALLGAAGLGDKGVHFPSTDPQLKDISSLALLVHVASMLGQAGWRISNVDATILAQNPRLSPFISTMIQRTSEALSVPPERVSIKVTTTDYMGFVGRAEGIAAIAVASLMTSR